MRADIFHASSLLLKYGEYSEANLTHEVSRLLSEKTNLTEALGVSAQLGSVMQATYEEMMESGVFELKSYSSGFLSNSVICGFCGKQSSFAVFQPWSGLVPAVPAFVQRVQTHLFPHVSLQNLCLISLIVSMPR